MSPGGMDLKSDFNPIMILPRPGKRHRVRTLSIRVRLCRRSAELIIPENATRHKFSGAIVPGTNKISGFVGVSRRRPMKRTDLLLKVRRMLFEEVYGIWRERRLMQDEAAGCLECADGLFAVSSIAAKNRGLMD